MILDYSTKLAKAILIKVSIIQKSTLDKTAEILEVVVSLLIFLWRVSRHIFTFDSLLALLLTLSSLLSLLSTYLHHFPDIIFLNSRVDFPLNLRRSSKYSSTKRCLYSLVDKTFPSISRIGFPSDCH